MTASKTAEQWYLIAPFLERRNLSPATLKNMRVHFSKFFEVTGAKELEDLLNIENTYQLIDRFENNKPSYIQTILRYLSMTLKSLIIASDYDTIPVFNRQSKNPFEYILHQRKFIGETTHHLARSKSEIELYISNMPELKNRLPWELGAMGLRHFEVFQLEKKQFDLEDRSIKNVLRKGRKRQKKLGIPQWLIKPLEIHLRRLGPNDPLFKTGKSTNFDFNTQYWANIQKMHQKIASDPSLMSQYQDTYTILDQTITNGKVTMHQLRSSWDTFAKQLDMNDTFRLYHLNHSQGMDDIYIQLAGANKKIWKRYLEELDEHSVQYDFGE